MYAHYYITDGVDVIELEIIASNKYKFCGIEFDSLQYSQEIVICLYNKNGFDFRLKHRDSRKKMQVEKLTLVERYPNYYKGDLQQDMEKISRFIPKIEELLYAELADLEEKQLKAGEWVIMKKEIKQ